MKKWCLYMVCLILIGGSAKGQYYRQDRGFMLGVNAGYWYPTGDMGEILKNGLGGNLSAKYLINRVIGIGFEAGYHSFKPKVLLDRDDISQDYKCHVLPVLLEATFYIPTWNRTTLPYLGLQFGAYITNINVKQQENYPDPATSKKLYLFSPGVGIHGGVMFELSDRIWIDLKLRADYVPKIEEGYEKDDYGNKGHIGFDKMLNIGANVGLLYKF